jgi:hypothetical protein
MKSSHLLLASTTAIAFVSCAPKPYGYDTPNPYGTPDAGYGTPYQPPVNPTYDTPAAYEESTGGPATVDPADPSGSSQGTPTTGRPATVHTIVAGDYLGKIAAKYKVSIASIKKANNMTTDTVVLGKKLIIPAN